MKLTINLTDAEAKGIKAYLDSGDEDSNKAAIESYVQNMVSNMLHDKRDAVSDYVNRLETCTTS